MKFAPFILLALMSGCTTVPHYEANDDPLAAMLAKAANDATQSLDTLAQANNAAVANNLSQDQRQALITNSTYTPPGLEKKMVMPWRGPIESPLSTVALQGKYTFSVMGKTPANPITVQLDGNEHTLIELLRQMSNQAGERAAIKIIPEYRLIELHYKG